MHTTGQWQEGVKLLSFNAVLFYVQHCITGGEAQPEQSALQGASRPPPRPSQKERLKKAELKEMPSVGGAG